MGGYTATGYMGLVKTLYQQYIKTPQTATARHLGLADRAPLVYPNPNTQVCKSTNNLSDTPTQVYYI